MKKISLSIIIPAFNEEKTIREVVLDAAKCAEKITSKFEIIVLNDASTDNTLKILKKIKFKQLKVISHTRNQGIEPTLRQLYDLAKYEYCFFNGADGDIDMDVMVAMYHKLFHANADIVVGNRISKNYTLKRKIVSNAYNKLTRLLTSTMVYDAGTVKFVKTSFFQHQKIMSNSVVAEAERLVRAKHRGAVITKHDIIQNQNKKNDSVNFRQLASCFLDLVRLSVNLWFSSFPKPPTSLRQPV